MRPCFFKNSSSFKRACLRRRRRRRRPESSTCCAVCTFGVWCLVSRPVIVSCVVVCSGGPRRFHRRGNVWVEPRPARRGARRVLYSRNSESFIGSLCLTYFVCVTLSLCPGHGYQYKLCYWSVLRRAPWRPRHTCTVTHACTRLAALPAARSTGYGAPYSHRALTLCIRGILHWPYAD